MKKYDVIIVGAGPGGVFAAHEFAKKSKGLKIACFEQGKELVKRHCPIHWTPAGHQPYEIRG